MNSAAGPPLPLSELRAPLAIIVSALPPADPSALEALLTPFRYRTAFRSVALDDIANLPPTADNLASTVIVADIGAADPADARLDQLLNRPPAPIIVVSEVDDTAHLLTALRRGATGFLLDDISGDELISAVHRARAGQVVVDPTMAGRIARQLANGTWQDPPLATNQWKLRSRERQVLESLVAGRSNRQIADDLNLGEETVKTYLRTTYRKIGAQNRAQAIAVFLGRRPLS